MSTATNVLTSTPADEVFSIYKFETTGNAPYPDPVTPELRFEAGFGRDTIGVDTSTYSSPGGITRAEPQPYVIKLGAGINPADLQLVSLDDAYVTQSNTRATSGWAVEWQIRVKHTGDMISIKDYQETTNPTHDVPRALIGIEFADGTVWTPAQIQALLAQPANATSALYGGAGSDLLVGDAMARHLVGGQGDDTLVSGTGHELLQGGDGLNTYRFAPNSGNDTIRAVSQPQGTSPMGGRIEFGAGVSPDQVTVYRDHDHLVLQLADGSSVTFEAFGSANTDAGRAINSVAFANGTTWSFTEVFQRFAQTGTDGRDTLQGLAGDELLSAGAGDDVLQAFGGRDTLQGGDGRDQLQANAGTWVTMDGGRGNDTLTASSGVFQYGTAFGQDRLQADFNSADTVVEFKDGIVQSQLAFHGNAQGDLIVQLKSTGDSLRLSGYLSTVSGDAAASLLRFADGTTLTRAQVVARQGVSVSMAPTTGVTLSGTTGNDRLVGTAGPDVFNDSTGNDVIEVTPTGGVDVLNLSSGAATDKDVVLVKGPFRASDVTVQRSTTSTQDVIVSIGNLGQINISALSASLPADRLTFKFDDGSSLDTAELVRLSWLGTSGNDRFSTSIGGDTRDTYVFGRGDGQDSIYGFQLEREASLRDQLILTTKDVTFSRYSDNDDPLINPIFQSGLQINVNGTSDRLRLGYSNLGNDDLPFVTFLDGSTLSPRQINELVLQAEQAKAGVPGTTGTFRSESLVGTTGNDLIEAGQGDDQINLTSGGVDTLEAWRGDGNDVVQGDLDVLRLRGGIALSDLQFSGANQVSVLERGRVIYSLTADALGVIQLDDGTLLSSADRLQAAYAGSPLNDSLVGTSGDDLIRGQAGNDTLKGEGGRDTLFGDAGSNTLEGGDGDDVLHADGQGDALVGGAGHDTLYIGAAAMNVGVQGALSTDSADDLVLDFNPDQLRLSFYGGQLEAYKTGEAGGRLFVVGDYFGANGATALRSITFKDGSVLNADGIAAATLQATMADDSIEGSARPDLIQGLGGNDSLSGQGGNDTLVGGLGQDALVGGEGNDTYRYNRGDGFDTINVQDQQGSDVLALGAGITASDFVVIGSADNANDMTLIFKDRNGGIRITGANGTADLPNVKLASGQVLTGASLYASRLTNVGTTGNNTLWADVQGTWLGDVSLGAELYGGRGNDQLNGNIGNDALYGDVGMDTLAGGKGQDLLVGGKGSDTYLFNRGDGQDVIQENDSTWLVSDRLQLGDATSKQLWFTKDGSNLNISVIGTQDQVVVQDWFLGSAYRVERITASDGKSLTAAKVQTLVNAMASFTPPADGVTTLPASTPTTITKVIASSWV
ncbi:MAG TPA: calcium-binding protein [Aquabacterium sp.]|nr:calcium-binding protein [Aquabacterium sp.]HRH27952.1 calcium-binding protein [Aquabacterium sp.]